MGSCNFLKSEPLTSGFKPFTFYSDRHQRYESDVPVGGLQVCGRIFTVENNVNGCDGYILKARDGYIVKAINVDTGREQFAPKPMRIVFQSPSKVVLRGYKTQARTPFGYIDFDGDDYGLEVYYEHKAIVKCIFHMYDRDVCIEYMGMGGEKSPNAMLKVDKYYQIINNARYNPFKITTNPILNSNCTLTDLTHIIKKEIEDLYDMIGRKLHSPKEWMEYLSSYIFSLLESYYKNAGYIPKVMMDEIIKQVFNALTASRYAAKFASLSLIDLKDMMYYALTTK